MSKGLASITMFDVFWILTFSFCLSTSSGCTNEEFRVATYNILYTNCGGYSDYCNCASSSPANYAANNIRPDVLGTQENGCQVDFGNDMGSPYEVVPYTCQSCNHNAIYFNSNNIQYDGVAGVEETVYRDNYSTRMYSWAKMRTKGGFVFWVFNVHNPHEHGNPSGFQGDIAEQMIDKWQELGGDEPAVFTGDFNPHKDNNRWESYATSHGLTKVGESDGGVCGFCDQIYVSNGDFDIVSTQVHGSGGSDHNAYSAVLRPRCGGSNPNSPPVSPPGNENSDVKVIEWIGADSCTPQSPCRDAQSDCDTDADCAGDLICWQRDQGETREGYDASNINSDADACVQPETSMAQCTQSGGDRYGPDMGGCCDSLIECDEPRSSEDSVYCAEWTLFHGISCWSYITMCRETCDSTDSSPSAVKVVAWLGQDGCTERRPCQDAQSDCDNDAQCAGDLICWQRDNGETRQEYDTSQINADADVCVQNESTTPSNPTNSETPDSGVTHVKVVEWIGQDACSERQPCQDAQSDCDNDAQCAGDLICWQRDNGETRQGYDASQINADADVCVQKESTTNGGLLSLVILVSGLNNSNKRQVCDTVSTRLEGSTSYCSVDGPSGLRRNLQTTGNLYIDVNVVDTSLAKQTISSEDFASSLQNLPEGVQVTEVSLHILTLASMSDEFSGSSVDTSKWEVMHFDASWKNQEKQCYVPQNTKVENGNLVLTATARSGDDDKCGRQEYFSGSIEAKTYFLHGSMEVRARLPSGDGLWPAIWLLGNDQETTWPACGEIDLMEVANKDPIGSKATLHYGPVGGGSINLHFGNTPKVALKSEFHTWKIIRTSQVIVMLFDGQEFGRKTRSQIDATNYAYSDTMFDAPMRLVLNVAVGGQFTGIGNQPPNMETWDKATLEVDYVRTSDDQTIPDVPCMETVVCDSDTCASCQSRIDWLMDNRSKNYIQAKDQVKSEFPNECNCDSQFGVSSLEGESIPTSNENDSNDGSSIRFIVVIILAAGVLLLIVVTVAWSRGHCLCCLPKDDVEYEFKAPTTSHELAL